MNILIDTKIVLDLLLEREPYVESAVETALSLGLIDFEDGIHLACASLAQFDAIVTRDPKDFSGSNLPICSPTELLNQL